MNFFFKNELNDKKGLTIVEILVVISVLAVLSSITILSFGNIRDNESLEKTALRISSILEDARSLTLASKEDSSYGVFATTTHVVLFKGDTYSESDPDNKRFDFNTNVIISENDFSDGGDVITFVRLTGKTNQNGTTTVSLVSDPSQTKNVFIGPTGLIEVFD